MLDRECIRPPLSRSRKALKNQDFLGELEAVGLVEKKLIALHTPYHIYIKLPTGENIFMPSRNRG